MTQIIWGHGETAWRFSGPGNIDALALILGGGWGAGPRKTNHLGDPIGSTGWQLVRELLFAKPGSKRVLVMIILCGCE